MTKKIPSPYAVPGLFITETVGPLSPNPGETVCLQKVTIHSLQHWDELRPAIESFFKDHGPAACVEVLATRLKNCAGDCCPWCGK